MSERPPMSSIQNVNATAPQAAESSLLGPQESANVESSTPFLSGHPILPEDMDYRDIPTAQLYEMNQKLLEESIPIERPLMSEPSPISALREEYENGSPSFLAQIDELVRQGFTTIIRTRGDGDCFYRSLAFAYIDRLIHAGDRELAVATALSSLEAANLILRSALFDEIVYELPYGVLADLINDLRLTRVGLLNAFQDAESQIPQYIVMYMRLLTSAQIRTAPEDFSAFIMHPDTGTEMTIEDFCQLFVDPMGKEADHVQITALSRALGLRVRIAYLDGRSSDGKVEFVEFNYGPDPDVKPLLLLYRPGHYDIIEQSKV